MIKKETFTGAELTYLKVTISAHILAMEYSKKQIVETSGNKDLLAVYDTDIKVHQELLRKIRRM